jgi:hypothetical protein
MKMNFNETLLNSLNFYKKEVNSILVDFSNSCDTNTICYSLFHSKSDGIKSKSSNNYIIII